MKPLILVLLSILSWSGPGAQSSTPRTQLPADHAVIQRRRFVIVRSATLVRRFPSRKTAIVSYPMISGLSPVVLRRVRTLLDFKNIFDYSLGEYRNDSWLSEFTYVVNYNANSFLDITFSQSGVAAYPDEQSRHFLINLEDGRIVKATDVFVSDKLPELAAAVNKRLQDELDRMAKANASSDVRDSQDIESIKEAYETLRFEVQNLDDFSVGRKGLTFLYDAGFPHVIKALEPKGHYFFSYQELRPYLRRGGLLNRFVS